MIYHCRRNQTLIDFEEFMLPQARENLQKFWAGAMGNAAKELKNSDQGAGLSLLHSLTSELEGQPWYIQALGSKLLPAITDAVKPGGNLVSDCCGNGIFLHFTNIIGAETAKVEAGMLQPGRKRVAADHSASKWTFLHGCFRL